jgi:hypothetical protein
VGGARGDEDRAAGVAARRSGIEGADEAPVAVTLTAITSSQTGWSTWVMGASSPSMPGIAEQDVELAPSARGSPRRAVEGVVVLEVHGHEGRRRAARADRVVELLEGALRAGERHDVRAGLRQRERAARPMPAGGAGDDGDAVREGLVHGGSVGFARGRRGARALRQRGLSAGSGSRR